MALVMLLGTRLESFGWAPGSMTNIITTLLLVDVQNDFHPLEGSSLAIPGALEDAERIASLICEKKEKIDRIVCTLDSHHKLHIAHPCFWIDPNTGEHPQPFTIIHSSDIEAGKWKPRDSLDLSSFADIDPILLPGLPTPNDEKQHPSFDLYQYVLAYTRSLEQKGRFQLCIWPEHCLIGSPGHAIVDVVRKALDQWSDATGASVEYVFKGQHLLTEMYSALQAEVPINDETKFNPTLFQKSFFFSQFSSQKLLVCGQAMSHCVNYTLRDIAHHWPSERRHEIILLRDCASSVPGFEQAGIQFQEDMKAIGVQICASDELEL